ncbi:hypothetical protein Are01nite_50600 [Actinoplanes regularis]|nr:hypothetical protein Are01nite_50600 [Actinoplanes regularis]
MDVYGIGRWLWARGEREVATDCLRLAARCEVSEAEADVIVLKVSGGSRIADGAGFAPDENARAISVSSGRRPRVKMAVAAAIFAVGAAGVAVVSKNGTTPPEPQAQQAAMPGSSQVQPGPVVSGRLALVLPPTYARFSRAPSTHGRSTARGGEKAPARLEYQVAVDARPHEEFVVSLQSDPDGDACRWNLVRHASGAPPEAAEVKLNRGEQRQVKMAATVPANLKVYVERSGRKDGCPVLGGRFRPGTPLPASADAPSAAPVAPEPAQTPVGEPGPPAGDVPGEPDHPTEATAVPTATGAPIAAPTAAPTPTGTVTPPIQPGGVPSPSAA